MAFVLCFLLMLGAISRSLRVAPAAPANEPILDAVEPPVPAAPPSVPPPPPPSPTPAVQKKHPRVAPKPQVGTIRTELVEAPAPNVVVIRELPPVVEPQPVAPPALVAEMTPPPMPPAPGPVIVEPPVKPKQDSRGVRWIKAVGKALRVVPQKDLQEDDAFRSAPHE